MNARTHQAIDPAIYDRIMERLLRVEHDYNVKILFAVESGSRAWGMWSPDSDYDVRFVYVHPPEWYLSISETRRDVIETPLDAIFDVNGWELRKTLRLMIKPNAVVHEWLCSPILYRRNLTLTQQLLSFAEQVFERKTYAHHYGHLANNQLRTLGSVSTEVRLKKYLYAVRPALALMWIAEHPKILPPMNIDALLAGLDLSAGISKEITSLIRRKRTMNEDETFVPSATLHHFVQTQIERGLAQAEHHAPRSQHLWDAGDGLFRQILREAWAA